MDKKRSGERMKLGAFFHPTGNHVAAWLHPDAATSYATNSETGALELYDPAEGLDLSHLFMRPIVTLIPYASNARTHSDAQIAQIAASIREFGFTNPILLDGKQLGDLKELGSRQRAHARASMHQAEKIVMRPIVTLIPYASNARTHSDAQIAQIAASIREFGFTNPVLIDEEDGIIAGSGRVLAAHVLGLDEVPCIVLAHLTSTQRRAYVLADNKLALNAGWDLEMLSLEIGELGEAKRNFK